VGGNLVGAGVTGRGIGGHQSAAMGKDEWLTPPDLVRALGPFDLDPCSPGDRRPWDTAKVHYGLPQDGLALPWFGRVWLNPPYGREADAWLAKLVDHGNGIALIFARTETDMFFDRVWHRADAVLFLRGRLHFHHVSGERAAHNSGAPSVLAAYGAQNATALRHLGPQHQYIALGVFG
jgi:hypothetical protein